MTDLDKYQQLYQDYARLEKAGDALVIVVANFIRKRATFSQLKAGLKAYTAAVSNIRGIS